MRTMEFPRGRFASGVSTIVKQSIQDAVVNPEKAYYLEVLLRRVCMFLMSF